MEKETQELAAKLVQLADVVKNTPCKGGNVNSRMLSSGFREEVVGIYNKHRGISLIAKALELPANLLFSWVKDHKKYQNRMRKLKLRNQDFAVGDSQLKVGLKSEKLN